MNDTDRDELLIALDKLNQNQVATNNAISELQHYIIEQDKKEEEEKEEAEEQALKEAEEQEIKTKKEEETKATRSQQEQEQIETYQEILSDGLNVQNGLIAGQFVTDGIICGVLLLTVLWNKLN